MGHGSRSPRETGRTISLIAVAVAVLCLALPGLALASHSTAPGWYWLNPLPAGDRASYDVSMLGDEAWVGMGARYLLHSTDAGRTFQPVVTTDGSGYFRMVDFVSSSTGFAYRDYSGVFRTLDGGHTWTLVQAITLSTVDDLLALDATHAWVQVSGGTDAGQYRTVNGTTWTMTTLPRPLADVAFTDVNNGWAVSNAYPEDGDTGMRTATSTIHKTTDGGATWTPWRTTMNEELLSVAVPSASRVVFGGAFVEPFYGDWAEGQVPRVVVMTDSGTTFTNVTVPGSEADVVEFAFSDASRGWATLSNQSSTSSDTSAIVTTSNGGDGWTTIRQPGMGALDCDSSGTVLATGGSPYVYIGITQRGWSNKDVLRAVGGGAFESTDFSTLDRSLAIGELSFADAERGWALHAKSVSRTQNGGASWQTQTIIPEHTSPVLYGLASSPSDAVWVVGSAGTMQKSTDGGASWATVDPSTSQGLVDVAFGDASVGWAVGGTSLQRTTNGGQTWFPVSPDVRYTWDGVAAPSASAAFFTGRDGTASRDCIVRTANGGSSFDAVLIAGAGIDLKGVWFRSTTDGWAFGSRGALYHTTDGGVNWSPVGLGGVIPESDLPAVTVTDVVFETATRGWAFCELALSGPVQTWYLLATADGGATWADAGAATGLMFADRLLAAASTGGRTWFGGYDGTLLADFNADALPPVTTSSYDGRWTNQPVSLTLSAADAGAGAAYSRYRYKTAAWAYGTTPPTVDAPSNHSNDGAWRLLYYSVDVFGQVEATKTQFIKIDTQTPQGAVVEPSPALVANKYVGPDFSLRWSGLDWATPVVVAAQSSVNAVNAVGDVAYVLDGALLRVVDFSKPMSPSQLGSVELPGAPTDVKVVGDFAYVAAGDAGLIVVYVGEPGQPEVAGVARLDGSAAQVAVTNDMAYAATAEGRVAIVDVRDAQSPGQLDLMEVREAIDVAAEGDLLSVATDRLALTYDVSRPDRPGEIGGVELGTTPEAIALSGDLACVAAGFTQYVLGLDVRGRPTLLDSCSSGFQTSDVTVNGVLLQFVSQNGILALDATTPDETVFAGGYVMPVQPPVALDAAGEYAYIADGTGGLQIMKAMPIEAASYVLDVDGEFTGPDETPEPDARTVSFTGVSEGAKVFRVKTRDQAGNWNAHVNFQLTVDATGPQMSANADGLWHRSFALSIAASDALSGLAGVEYRVDGGAWQTGASVLLGTWKRGGNNGSHAVDGRATDRVGNVSQGSWTVNLDSQAPITSDDAPCNPLDPWNPPSSATPVTVHLTAGDTHSGVAETWYRLDGGVWSQGTQATVVAPANGSNDGRHWVGYYSVDNAGNIESAHWVPVVIDVPGAPAAKAAGGRTGVGIRKLLLGTDLIKAVGRAAARR